MSIKSAISSNLGVALGIVFLFLLNWTAQSATYYVDRLGSDTASGLAGAPWQTVTKAAKSVIAGDRVMIAPGRYEETLSASVPGTAIAPIEFNGQGGASIRSLRIKAPYYRILNMTIAGNTNKFDALVYLDRGAHQCILSNNVIDAMLAPQVFGLYFNLGTPPLDPGTPSNCLAVSNVIKHINLSTAISLGGVNNLIQGNRLEDMFDCDAFHIWGHDNSVSGNTVTNMQQLGAYHMDITQTYGATGGAGYAAYNILFEKNLIINCPPAQIGQMETWGSTNIVRDWTLRNNIYIRVGMQINISVAGVQFLDNLFYQCATNSAHALGYWWYPNLDTDRGQAFRGVVKNNIFLECGNYNSRSDRGWYQADPNITDFVADNNYVGGVSFARKNSGLTRSLATFFELHGINGGNPAFQSLANLMFVPQAGSPLIGAGATISQVTDDFIGTSRSARYDIGPFQTRSLVSPPQSLRVAPLQ